jgi:hypothetical protein
MSLLDHFDIDLDEADAETRRIEEEFNLTLDSSKIHLSDGVEAPAPAEKKPRKAPVKRKQSSAPKAKDKIQALRKKHKNQTAAQAFEIMEKTIDTYADSTQQEAFEEAQEAERKCREIHQEIRSVCRMTAKAASEQKACADLLKRMNKETESALLLEAAQIIERLNGEFKKQSENIDHLASMFSKNSGRIFALARQKQVDEFALSKSTVMAESDTSTLTSQVAIHQKNLAKIDAPVMAIRAGSDGSLALTTKTQSSSFLGKLSAGKKYLELSLARVVPPQAQSVAALQNRSSAAVRMQKERARMESFASGQVGPEVKMLALPAPTKTLRIKN